MNGVHAARACAAALGDFGQFVGFEGGNESVPFSGVSSGLVVRCRRCLGSGSVYPGDASCCVEGLETVCGHTMRGRLIVRQCPFGRMCANVSGAMGQTIPTGVVQRVHSVSLDRSSSLRCTESLFVFDFCAQKVSFVSVTCLGGDGLRGNFLSCHEGGAGRRLMVG